MGLYQGSGLAWHKQLCQGAFPAVPAQHSEQLAFHMASSKILTLNDVEICVQKDI